MSAPTWQPKSDFAREYFNKGPSKIAPKRLEVLATRSIPVTDEARRRITECTDVDQLKEWFRRAITAATVDEVYRRRRVGGPRTPIDRGLHLPLLYWTPGYTGARRGVSMRRLTVFLAATAASVAMIWANLLPADAASPCSTVRVGTLKTAPVPVLGWSENLAYDRDGALWVTRTAMNTVERLDDRGRVTASVSCRFRRDRSGARRPHVCHLLQQGRSRAPADGTHLQLRSRCRTTEDTDLYPRSGLPQRAGLRRERQRLRR